MKKKLLFLGMILLMGYLISCKKNKVEVAPEKAPDIYISGTDSQSRTVYWVNGKIYGTGTDNQPGSMVVSGGDVYFLNIRGYQKNNLQIINEFSGAGFTDLAVSGEDVYLVGYGDVNDTVPFYWKNNQKIKVKSDLPALSASRIAISENRIYLAGNIYKGSMAGRFFYGTEGTFTIADKGSISKMKVDGDVVYIIGQDENFKSCYWKNGVKHQLYSTNNNIVDLRDIYIKDKDVYVVGYSYDSIPAYWKNDKPMGKDLYRDVIFSSIAVYDNNVYIVGTIYSSLTAFVWKDGILDTIRAKTSVNKIIIK